MMKNNLSVGDEIKCQLGEMIINKVYDDTVEVYRKQDKEKLLKNMYVIPVCDICDEQPVKKSRKQDKQEETEGNAIPEGTT